jgi:hypothetical protein
MLFVCSVGMSLWQRLRWGLSGWSVRIALATRLFLSCRWSEMGLSGIVVAGMIFFGRCQMVFIVWFAAIGSLGFRGCALFAIDAPPAGVHILRGGYD